MSTYRYALIACCISSTFGITARAVANVQVITNDNFAIADTLSDKEPISFNTPFEINLPVKPIKPDADSIDEVISSTTQSLPSQRSNDDSKITDADSNKTTLTEQYSQQNNLLVLEDAINDAIKSRQWQALQHLLPAYKQQPDHDLLLYYYALGGIYRSQNRHKEAIAAYQTIIDAEPELVYPRFDLGVMLFENKQYQQAEYEIQRARSGLDSQMQQLADSYLEYIKQRQRWQFDASINYEATDNVNNASSTRVINWGGKQWRKTEDSLPQSAHGIRYALEASRDVNITGNHFGHMNVDINGVHYWDNSDYSEQSTRLAAGYEYRDIKTTFSLTPFVEHNWLGGDSYNQMLGINTYSRYQLNDKWQTSAGLGYSKKEYRQPSLSAKYDGHILSTNGTLLYTIDPTWLVYGSLNWSDDRTEDAEKASIRRGISLGTTKLLQNGLGVRFGTQYAKRDFKAAGTLVYPFIREDKEYRLQSELWHNKLSYKGLVPHLNISYLNIDSNMPGFYSRDEFQWLISLQKSF
ncbi:surface lipoprotein assembly modifier [Psychrobacter sp. FDAARGOS_221]|uniref:surface lipoprotein assembly modifier n=1 Tax=Psychrobacter sp. FDAARGOS_221 TaxID=1975705 RepID=UPI001D0D2B3B|nr:surface lipoprotein assembly modifier [Psychrobacter sp. FDAARGOS_221]